MSAAQDLDVDEAKNPKRFRNRLIMATLALVIGGVLGLQQLWVGWLPTTTRDCTVESVKHKLVPDGRSDVDQWDYTTSCGALHFTGGKAPINVDVTAGTVYRVKYSTLSFWKGEIAWVGKP